MNRPLTNVWLAAALAVIPLVTVPVSAATDGASKQNPDLIEAPSEAEVEEKLPLGEAIDGEEIYDRFLENRRRLRSAYQEGRILSTDPGGNEQLVRIWILGKDYRDENDDAVANELGRILLRVVGPSEIEQTGYLYIDLDVGEDQQFMYSPHRRRTSRITLKGQSVAGTDFSFDDFLLSLDEIEDAVYERRPDEIIQGVPCYVVEAKMKETSNSSYSRSLNWIEKEHYVPLKTRNWDDVGVEVKLLESPHASIREFDGVWIATEVQVTDLLEETSSTMIVERLQPDADIDDSDVSVQALQFTR